MSDKHFENSLRDRLDSYRSELDHEQLWDQVEAELYPKRKRRAAIWWWLGSGVTVLLLLYLITTLSPDYPTNPPTPDLGGPTLRSETSEDVATQLPTTHLPTTHNSPLNPAPDLGGPALRSETSEDVATQLPTTQLPTTLYPLPHTPYPVPSPNPVLQEAAVAKVPFRRWSLLTHLSAGQPGSVVKNLEGFVDDNFLNEDLGAWGAGFTLGYRFAPRWSLSTGLDYQQLLTRFEGEQLVSREEESVPVVIERIVYADGAVVERMGTGIRTTSVYRRTRFTHRLHMLNVPLLLGYESLAAGPRSFNWYVQGGALLNMRQQISGQSLDREGNPYDLSTTGEYRNRIGLGAQLGAGISRTLRHNLSFQLGVEARHFFSRSTSSTANYNIRFNPISMKAGIRWRF